MDADRFYIIRTDYHGEKWLYAMTDTLADALKCIHEENLMGKDTAIEFCRGIFPNDYEITKTLFAKPKNR